jgi:hypothetical protein
MQLPIVDGPLVDTLQVAGPSSLEDLECGASVLPKSAAPIVKEICPRGNNNIVIIIFLVHDNVYTPC